MSESAVHFSDSSPGEQGENGVSTGFGCVQPYEKLEVVASEWKEGDRLDVLLLRAICRLSVEHPGQASKGFASQDIVGTVGNLRRRSWSSKDDKDQMSDDVRRYWNKLIETWETKEEGVRQRLNDEGVQLIPLLRKTEGGGGGRTSRYRVEWSVAVRDQTPSTSMQQDHGVPKGHVKYVSEDLADAGGLTRVLARGYLLEGWRRTLFISAVVLSIVVGYVLTMVLLFGITFAQDVNAKLIFNTALSLGLIGWLLWTTTGRLIRLATNKIVLAPWWMQSVDDDRLLERRDPPRFGERSIKAVRYTARCQICGGRLAVKSGGIEYWGRLVGRCEHAPVEHVYAFDHVTRAGKPLR